MVEIEKNEAEEEKLVEPMVPDRPTIRLRKIQYNVALPLKEGC